MIRIQRNHPVPQRSPRKKSQIKKNHKSERITRRDPRSMKILPQKIAIAGGRIREPFQTTGQTVKC
jgi:hypothetical protein